MTTQPIGAPTQTRSYCTDIPARLDRLPRALAIAVFYAFGTGLGGLIGPTLFGALIETGVHLNVLYGYLIGAALMIFAALAQARWGVAAERRSLEQVARPLAQLGDT